jgi:hypothetical protein
MSHYHGHTHLSLADVLEYLKENLRVSVEDDGQGDRVFYVRLFLDGELISEDVLPVEE